MKDRILTWDKCNKCNTFITLYYDDIENYYDHELMHVCCNCCKGSEWCNK